MKFIVEGKEFDNYEQAQAYEQELKVQKEAEQKEKAEVAKELFEYLRANAEVIQVEVHGSVFTLIGVSESDKEKYATTLLWDVFGLPYMFNSDGIKDRYSIIKLDRRKKDVILKQVVEDETLDTDNYCDDSVKLRYSKESMAKVVELLNKFNKQVTNEPSLDEFMQMLFGLK